MGEHPEAISLIIAQFGYAFLRELGFRRDHKLDAYVYEGPNVLSMHEVRVKMERAGG